MSPNPFEQMPLQGVLTDAIDQARAVFEDAFTVQGVVLMVQLVVDDEPLNGASAYPLDDFDSHARLCRGAVEIFEAAGAIQPPLLQVIFDGLKMRGWTMRMTDGAFMDPEGNAHATVDAAIAAQTFREIGQAGQGLADG